MKYSLTEANSRTGFLKSKDQTSLFFRHYPLSNHKASVVLIHGFGEHSGRYLHVIDRLVKEKFQVFTLDLRGHGYSEGKRGDIADFRSYEDDVIAALEHAQKNLRLGKKLFIVAHSMGALITLRVAIRNHITLDGMVLSCPLLKLNMPMPAWKKWATFTMARVLPKTRLSSRIKGNQLSKDQAMAKAYDADPLVLKNLSARTFWEIFKSYQGMDSLASALSLAFLMQVGGNDQVVDPNAATNWFNHVDHERVDATLKVYPDLLHEIYNEANRQVPIDDAVAWLNQRA